MEKGWGMALQSMANPPMGAVHVSRLTGWMKDSSAWVYIPSGRRLSFIQLGMSCGDVQPGAGRWLNVSPSRETSDRNDQMS